MNPIESSEIQQSFAKEKTQKIEKVTKKFRDTIIVISFLLPATLIYGLFVLYPIFDAIRLSFFDWDGASPQMNFIGLKNYLDLGKDEIFLKSLGHNFYWVVLSLILVVLPTLILSFLISKVKKGKTFFRVGFYLPSVLSLPVVTVMWSKIYDPFIGPITKFLNFLGLESWTRPWLGDPDTALPALIITSTWAFYGLYMILYLAGLQNIDYSLYEAAEIDGAGPIKKFWHVTVPGLRNTLNVVISLVIIYSFKGFALVWIMTQGGPFYMTEVVATYVYKSAFSMNNVSYGAAGSIVLGIIVITFTAIFNYVRERNE